eukprot:m51a1_g11368 hypothetical protein (1395) ;mRNA; r:305-4605
MEKSAVFEDSEVLPATSDQRRMFNEWQRDRTGLQYHLAACLRLHGRYDLPLLVRSLRTVFVRVEPSRTRFFEDQQSGTLQQEIIAENRAGSMADALVSVEDFTGDPQALARAQRTIEGHARQEWVLTRWPVARSYVVVTSDVCCALLVVAHHSVADATTARLLLSSVAAAYNHGVDPAAFPRPCSPQAPPAKMSQYVQWQQRFYTESRGAEDEQYWASRLRGFQPLCDLRNWSDGDTVHADGRSRAAERVVVVLERELDAAVKRAVAECSSTAFCFLSSALVAFLHLHCGGQSDISVYYPASTRPKHLGGLAGFMANTLVLRLPSLSGAETFHELLVRTTRLRAADRAHGLYSYSDLVTLLRRAGEDATTPNVGVGQTMLTAGPVAFAGLRAELERPDGGGAFADVNLLYDDAGDVAVLGLECRASLFSAERARAMCNCLVAFIGRAVAAMDAPLGSLLLVGPDDQLLIGQWNDTARPADHSTSTLVDLFDEAARQHSERIACDAASVTYSQLRSMALRLASALVSGCAASLECGRVGVCAARGPGAVAAVLGVLMSGCAYVPLDPAFITLDRARSVVEDSGLSVALADAEYSHVFETLGVRVLVIDDVLAGPPGAVLPLPPGRPGPLDLAYVIYTSGSTGRPKGVLQVHRTPVTFVRGIQRVAALRPDDVVLQHTSPSFDVSVEEVFHALAVGASLAHLPPSPSFRPDLLADFMCRARVSVAHFTPLVLAAVTAEFATRPERPPLRCVFVGGESLSRARVSAFLRVFPACGLYNVYGPTEAAYPTIAKCDDGPRDAPVTVGRPIASVQVYVMNQYLQLLPVGVAGEAFIGGDTLARGYTDPELTRASFVPAPSGLAPRVLYRVGDVLRYTRDCSGELEFLRRVDRQVKVRGVRVELGDIECALRRLAGVSDAAVVARRLAAAAEPSVVAYVVLRPAGGQSQEDALSDVRAQLSERLPAHMVPQAVVAVDRMPLNASGKVDTGALPAPEASAVGPGEHVEPRTELEREVAAIVASALHVGGVGATDNIFALGANSETVVRIVERLNELPSRGAPLRTDAVFASPTVEGLCRRLEASASAPSGRPVPPVIRMNDASAQSTSATPRPPLFLFHHGVGITTALYRRLADAVGPDQPIYAINNPLFGCAPADAWRSVDEMACKYCEAVRAHACPPFYLGGFCVGGLLALRVADRLSSLGLEVRLVVMLSSQYNWMFASDFQELQEGLGDDGRAQYRHWMLSRFAQDSPLFDQELSNSLALLSAHAAGRGAPPSCSYAGRLVSLVPRVSWVERCLAQGEWDQLFAARVRQLIRAGPMSGYPLVAEQQRSLRELQPSGDPEIYSVPGDHYSLFSEENVGSLASAVRYFVDCAAAQGHCVPERPSDGDLCSCALLRSSGAS